MNRQLLLLALVIFGGSLALADEPAVYVIEGRAMMPVRYASETFGAKVRYDTETKDIDISLAGRFTRLRTGKRTIKVGETEKDLDVAPVVYQGVTYVPVRAVSEALGVEVRWESKTRQVIVIRTGKKLVLKARPTPPGLAKKPGGLPPGQAKKKGYPHPGTDKHKANDKGRGKGKKN